MLEAGHRLSDLMARFPRPGRVQWIGLRPERGAAMEEVESAKLIQDRGLEGDRRADKRGGGRQVTLIQWEHLSVIASLCGREAVDPKLLRRNIAVTGISVNALKTARFRIGGAILQGTGYCHPCSRMEENLGPGGYNAVRGHGGITASVIESGQVWRGDAVEALVAE